MQKKSLAAASVLGLGAAFTLAVMQPSTGQSLGHVAAKKGDSIHFTLDRSAGVIAAGCLQDAYAKVTVKQTGITETMTVKAHNLVPNKEYDVFVIQVPNAPFGDSWYQGDLESDQYGDATGKYVGRFSQETFIVAPGVANAPHTHDGDATQNPASAPVHTYHVGIWFGSPDTAVKAGCPNTVTPFNGDHTAGIQALASTSFPDTAGPLSELE
jgi:hypothetical protein